MLEEEWTRWAWSWRNSLPRQSHSPEIQMELKNRQRHTHTHAAQCYLTLWTNLRFYLNHLPLLLSINLPFSEIEGASKGQGEVARWEETQKSNWSTLFLIHLPSYAQRVICFTGVSVGQQERGVNEVCVHTRFSRVGCDRGAPYSWSYGIEGLYLNLVLDPGTQIFYCGFSGAHTSLHVYNSVLALAVCLPYSEPVANGIWTAVVLWFRERLKERGWGEGEE